jgi:membrane protein required for colicin V production
MNSHQIVDLVVLAVLLYCAVKGASRGLLSQLAWVVALLLCFKFSGTLAPAIEPMIGVDPPLKQWIAMLVVYVGLCGLSFVAAGMLSSWMEKARVIDFDKHLGGVLGLVKGVVICMTGMFFAITMSEPMRQIVSKTYSGYAAAVILNNSQYLIPLLPDHTVPTVRNVIDEFNRRLQPGVDDLNGATPSDPDAFGDTSLTGSDGGVDDGFDLSRLFPGRQSATQPGSSDLVDSDPATAAPSLPDLLSQIPSQLRRELTQQAMDKLRNSSAEEKQRLLEQLNGSVPENAGSVLSNFFRNATETGSSGGQGLNSTTAPSAQLGRTETTLLNEIAGIYSQRNDIAANTRKYLAGVPSSVQRRVLEDWHADAMGLNADPDPVTDINTRLDERIVRQLARARISIDQLDRDLRTRLSDVIGGYERN